MADAFTGTVSYVRKGVARMTWTATVSGTGNPIDASHLPDKTLYLYGPTGGTTGVTIEGAYALTGPYWSLHDVNGALLEALVTGLVAAIQENPPFIRPRATTVTGGIVTISIEAKG